MRNLISHFVQENFARGTFRGQFPAVSLFVDLSGFTAMTEVLMEYNSPGAESLVVVMQTIFEPLVESVYAQGGFIARTAGDAFTALFPLDRDPSAYGRALAAGWQMQQHMSANPVHIIAYGSFTIQAKVGLGDGSVNWGIMTSPDGRRSAYYFQGTAVDRSTAAEHAAAPDTINELEPSPAQVIQLVDLRRAIPGLPRPGAAAARGAGGRRHHVPPEGPVSWAQPVWLWLWAALPPLALVMLLAGRSG